MNAGSNAEGAIVFGAPRSGTTLLRRLLNAHPEFACPGETNLFTSCARFLEGELVGTGIDISVVSGLSYAGFAEEEILGRLREFAFGFMRDHAAREGKSRWVEKTAFNSFHIDAIDRLCTGHVRYICILRHGLDVTSSLRDLCEVNDRYLSELHSYIRQFPRPLEAFAHAWTDITRNILAFAQRRADDTVVVRYEDLVADPNATMQRICASLGTTWSSDYGTLAMQPAEGIGLGDWKTYGKKQVDSSSVSRWKQLPRPTIARLAPIVNEVLVSAGYEEISTAAPLDQDARRRYELALMLQGIRGGSDSSTPDKQD